MESVTTKHIEVTPGTCGGKPRIVGSRIRVQDIVIWHEKQGRSPDEIVASYPHLTLAGVYAALAYYHDHRPKIERDMKEDDAFIDSMKADPSATLPQVPRTTGGDEESVSS